MNYLIPVLILCNRRTIVHFKLLKQVEQVSAIPSRSLNQKMANAEFRMTCSDVKEVEIG